MFVDSRLPSSARRDRAFPLRCLRSEIALPGIEGRPRGHVSALPATLDAAGEFSLAISSRGSL